MPLSKKSKSKTNISTTSQVLISDVSIPAATNVEKSVDFIENEIENSVKKEVDEILNKSTESESLKILLPLYSKLSKKYKRLKIKKEKLEKIIESKYSNTTILGSTIDLLPLSVQSFEILAGRCGAFKPHKVTILCKRKTEEPGLLEISCSVSICNIHVMGIPQLASYDGSTVYRNTFDSKFFEHGKIINWSVFGSSAGQGLQIDLKNFNNYTVAVSIIIEGDGADTSKIGLDCR